MKPHSSTINGPTFADAVHRMTGLAAVRLGHWTSATGQSVTRVITRVQVARMVGILSGMSDAQLAQIGIERREIRRFSDRLVAGEFEELEAGSNAAR